MLLCDGEVELLFGVEKKLSQWDQLDQLALLMSVALMELVHSEIKRLGLLVVAMFNILIQVGNDIFELNIIDFLFKLNKGRLLQQLHSQVVFFEVNRFVLSEL